MYRAYGPIEAFETWWGAVSDVCGEEGAVSPGGVSMFVRVSRAGVHKAMKEGRLTAFLFHRENVGRTFFTKREKIEVEGQPYIGIPVLECKSWAEQLTGLSYEERKLIRVGDGDHSGQFLRFREKDKASTTRLES